jgi:uncharacterized membrane protein
MSNIGRDEIGIVVFVLFAVVVIVTNYFKTPVRKKPKAFTVNELGAIMGLVEQGPVAHSDHLLEGEYTSRNSFRAGLPPKTVPK